MDKINHLIISILTVFCLVSCNDDDNGLEFEGADNFITSFELTVDGISYQADITGEKITVHVPYNVNLDGATAQVSFCEGSTINPNPATITDWNNEWKFIVTSQSGASRVYHYTYDYGDIFESNSVVLATQEQVDKFPAKGINRINGSLTIGTENGEDITNLDGLKDLVSISNSLIINPSYKGQDLAGLENLTTIGAFKLGTPNSVSKNTTLTSIKLPALTKIIGDFIVNSQVVESVSMPKLQTIEEGTIIISDALLDIDAGTLSNVGASLILRGSTIQKGTASTEAIVFASLSKIGGDLDVRYFPEIQGLYLPRLADVSGTISLNELPTLGSFAATELRSIGGLNIAACKSLSQIELPSMVSCGEMNIDASNVNKLNISSLTEIKGNVTLSNLLIEDLDISRIDFNGYSLTIKCSELKNIVGTDVFNGSIHLLPSQCTLPEFVINGIKTINGDFEAKDYFYVRNFVMPFEKIEGDLILALNTGSTKEIQLVDFSNLCEINGNFSLAKSDNKNVGRFSFSRLKHVKGLCNISTEKISEVIEFPQLKEIGTNSSDTHIFNISFANIVCPNLKSVYGSLDIQTGRTKNLLAKSIGYPNIEIISNNLIIESNLDYESNNVIKDITLPKLTQVNKVSISRQEGLNDFSTFKYLFENNILTEASQWIVTKCGYNPTFQDMKEGRYTPAE
ncbi:hypothetical protein [uncultured Bacteroides sp.]|uniref:hypothetical protein n=1 Tax=uncultured Bacteroides sp. TaxID=162156 RepID=UPI002630C6B6|nr:hypothetical protein [uncultured Bacteroides sp.]